MKTKDIVTERAIDYFGVGKRHCRVLHSLVVDDYMRSRPIDYFG
ncbi:hypothetical protein QUA20_06860 [Microcoleus sp. Pol7_A1]